jgi:hypothetical protein
MVIFAVFRGNQGIFLVQPIHFSKVFAAFTYLRKDSRHWLELTLLLVVRMFPLNLNTVKGSYESGSNNKCVAYDND